MRLFRRSFSGRNWEVFTDRYIDLRQNSIQPKQMLLIQLLCLLCVTEQDSQNGIRIQPYCQKTGQAPKAASPQWSNG